MQENPLVSVVVITYNSAKTVIETLDSIAAQTYQNIELIITDDCSKDDTVAVCKQWLKNHQDRFVTTKLLTVEKNTGTTKNINRGEANASAEWVKSIAGDDLLTPNCIEDCVHYVVQYPKTVFLFGRTEVFGESETMKVYFNQFFKYDFFKLSVKEKYQNLVEHDNCIPAPSVFSNINWRRELGLIYDERIPLLEDLPMWVKATSIGVDLNFIDKVICRYRVGASGLTSGSGSPKFAWSKHLYEIYYVYPYWYRKNPFVAEEMIIDYERALIDKERMVFQSFSQSYSFKLGNFMLSPLRFIKKIAKAIR